VLIATLSGYLVRLLASRGTFQLGASGVPLLTFVVIAIAAFLVSDGASPSPELMRRFGKLLASLLFFVVARNLIVDVERLGQLTRWLMLGGALQGAIGTGLMLLSPSRQLALLSSLHVVGYPTADVLRYVPGPNNTYTDQLRAIGTSVDPNVFGGTLMLALLLMGVQAVVPRPVLPRLAILGLALPTLAGVLLSLSRASWVGFGAGMLLLGGLRYRRILVIGLAGALVLLVSPFGQELLIRFVSGFSTADRATAFRLGEYTNALTLIRRYPLLGIGFGPSPDIDVTAGVSSVYLLVAEQTGLVGLGAYLAALAATWWTGLRALRRASDARLAGVIAAYLAALSGALVAGLLDHYFANQMFPHAVALFWLYAAGLVAAAGLTGRRGLGVRQRE
jgi:O-antigen ligase